MVILVVVPLVVMIIGIGGYKAIYKELVGDHPFCFKEVGRAGGVVVVGGGVGGGGAGMNVV